MSSAATATTNPGHHVVSAKTVPSSQPLPPASAPNGNGTARPTQGGKGQKGEEALEHAVAAREQVERRRIELKEQNGVGVAGARQQRQLEIDQELVKAHVKLEPDALMAGDDDNVEVEVVHGEEAEAIASLPVRSLVAL